MNVKMRCCAGILCAVCFASGSVPDQVWFPDFVTADAARYGTRTVAWTLGTNPAMFSQMTGTMSIPYTAGAVTAVAVSGLPFGDNGQPVAYAVTEQGVIFPAAIYLDKEGWAYISRDCSLSGPPSGTVHGWVKSGGIVEQGAMYAVAGAACQKLSDPQKSVITVQPLRIGGRFFARAAVAWQLDSKQSFRALDFHGVDIRTGLQAPAKESAANLAVTGFSVFAEGVGPVAGGDIDAASGRLTEMWEVVGITSESSAFPYADGTWSSLGPISFKSNTVAVSPSNPDLVFATAANGIFRSTDAGESWSPVNMGAGPHCVSELAFGPGDVMYAAACRISGAPLSLSTRNRRECSTWLTSRAPTASSRAPITAAP